jgi:hypothetical protein
MKSRRYFLLTAISGIIGMISLIATNLFKSWIENTTITQLSDKGVDQLHFLASGVLVSLIISQIAVAAFVVFLILYIISKNQAHPRA